MWWNNKSCWRDGPWNFFYHGSRLEDEQYFKDDQDSIFEYYDINKDDVMDIDEVSILKYESDSVSDNLYLYIPD